MSFFSKEAPFMTVYDVYWLPDTAKGVPKQTVDQVWILKRRKDGAYKEFDTKREAVKTGKSRARKTKPSHLFAYNKGGDSKTKHEFHGDHVYGDSLF